MAKPFREGKLWAVRVCINGVRHYRGGYRTSREAREAAAELERAVRGSGAPAFGGAGAVSVALALSLYAQERIIFHKGAEQEIRRVNRYLRDAGRDTLRLVALGEAREAQALDGSKSPYFRCERVRAGTPRRVPNGLSAHREAQAEATLSSDALRAVLARTPVAKITRRALQAFFDAMRREGAEPGTIALERALLRRLFNYARTDWNWSELADNPATGLTLPAVNNARERVMSDAEEARIVEALDDTLNPWLAPLVIFLVETATRISEPLLRASWDRVDYEAGLLRLGTSKTGQRDVPLSPRAVEILESLPRDPGEPRIFVTTYSAVKAAWDRVCARADVTGLRIQDLRHTAATRYALKCGGNKYLIKALTGHKTDTMVDRYVNINAGHVVEDMRERERERAAANGSPLPAAPDVRVTARAGNVVAVRFGSGGAA